MAYQVIALKFRPQKFEEVVGQKHISETLQNAISSGRIAHAYIFSGPRGVGKTTTARIFAKALNCVHGPTPDPCNECKNCIEITRGNNLDVIEIDGASNRGIDEIRNLRDNIRFAPVSGRYKIYIIDEVHMLTKESFNALLKTLEEPPSHAIFIFATTELHKVPQTILSRCQRYDFKSIPVREIVAQLDSICKKEGLNVSEDALLEIAKKADGAMRDAQSLLDQVISFAGNDVSLEAVRDALGLINKDLFFKASSLIADNDKREIVKFVREVVESGIDIAEFLSGLEEHFRNILVTKIIGSSNELEVSEEYKKRYLEEAGKFGEGDMLPYIQMIQDTQLLARRSFQPKMKFELLLLKMAEMPNSRTIEQILSALKKKNNLTSAENTQSAEKTAPAIADAGTGYSEKPIPPAPVSEKPVTIPDLNEVEQVWRRCIKEFAERKRTLLATQMTHCKPIKAGEDGIVEIGYAKENIFAVEHIKKNENVITPYLEKIFNRRVKLVFKETEFSGAERPKPILSPAGKFEELLKGNELLKEMVEDFDLKLIRLEEKKGEN